MKHFDFEKVEFYLKKNLFNKKPLNLKRKMSVVTVDMLILKHAFFIDISPISTLLLSNFTVFLQDLFFFSKENF